MTAGRAMPGGSSRELRLDPAALPVSFVTVDARADERLRLVEIDRDRVVVRREVAGLRMRVSLRMSNFLGVAIRVIPPDETSNGAVAIMLEHRDPGLSVPLMIGPDDGTDVVVEWERWARVLGRPLLIPDGEGSFGEATEHLGAVRLDEPVPRRRPRATLRRRRPSILLRRKPGHAAPAPQVYRGEREIIARN